MFKLFSYQIENDPTLNIESKSIRILVCNNHTETHIKKEFLLKEINYSPYHVFLDV